MNERQDLKQKEDQQVSAPQQSERSMRPAVDIFEDKGGITLHADMPGVSRERLDIQIEGDTLNIDGDATIEMPAGMEPLYADVRATHFRRSFILSKEMDREAIEANLKDGVLTLRIPKRAELQPRKIEVRTL
jgi:HSP20 family molecular chaperone IbpA